jgi:hypothetical protein
MTTGVVKKTNPVRPKRQQKYPPGMEPQIPPQQ